MVHATHRWHLLLLVGRAGRGAGGGVEEHGGGESQGEVVVLQRCAVHNRITCGKEAGQVFLA